MDKRDLNGFKPIGRYTNDLVKPMFGEKTPLVTRLASDWHLIVGADVAGVTKPVKIVFSRQNKDEGGVLTVDVESSFALEFQHRQGEMLERIATYFGYKLVKTIKLKQIPSIENKQENKPAKKPKNTPPREVIENMLADVNDVELHSALESFLVTSYKK